MLLLLFFSLGGNRKLWRLISQNPSAARLAAAQQMVPIRSWKNELTCGNSSWTQQVWTRRTSSCHDDSAQESCLPCCCCNTHHTHHTHTHASYTHTRTIHTHTHHTHTRTQNSTIIGFVLHTSVCCSRSRGEPRSRVMSSSPDLPVSTATPRRKKQTVIKVGLPGTADPTGPGPHLQRTDRQLQQTVWLHPLPAGHAPSASAKTREPGSVLRALPVCVYLAQVCENGGPGSGLIPTRLKPASPVYWK